MNLWPWVVSWAVLATVVILLAVYRRVVAAKEDDFLHVSDADSTIVTQQQQVAHKLELIDRWGKILTVVAFACGLALLGVYLYQGWQESLKYPQ